MQFEVCEILIEVISWYFIWVLKLYADLFYCAGISHAQERGMPNE